jgi:RNA polymerase sigma factor (sigma-70 family)
MTRPLLRQTELAVAADDALFAQLASGDLAPLGELFDRHHAAIRQFVLRLLLDPAEVDDVVQDTFLTASRAAGSFAPGAAAKPFLFGIAAQLVRRRRRGFARFRRLLGALGQHAGEPQPSAMDQLVAEERTAAVHAALAKLSDRHREVLVMVELGGMSGVEVSRALGVPAGTVWRRLSEARTELARRLVVRGDRQGL